MQNTDDIAWPMFEVPRPRPASLSDPFCDFPEELLGELLAKDDREHDWADYQRLLGPFLPAGTYDESVYFLPRAFSRILTHPKEALDLVSCVIGFTSEYAEDLRTDRVLDSARSSIRTMLEHWTASFDVTPYEGNVYVGESVVAKYHDYVHRGEELGAALEDLVSFKTHVDLAEEFVRSLAHHEGDPTRAAWFLELVRSRVAGDVRGLPPHDPFLDLVRDDRLQADAAATVRGRLIGSGDTSRYWRDCFAQLCL